MSTPERRQIRPTTHLLFCLLFICFAGAIIGDSTAEALLLSHYPMSLLPKLFLMNAVALFLASAFIMSLIDRVDHGRFFVVLAIGHGIMLLLIRGAVFFGATWLFPPLFTYAYIAKILLFLLFWTLANDLTDSRSAQKVFPRIAAGGTLGAIAVAFSIPFIVKHFAAENLLVVWSICSIALGLLVVPLRARAGRSFASSSDSERHRIRSVATTVADMKIILRDPLLATMALLYGTLFFVLITQHFFFYKAVKLHFASSLNVSNDIASFLGRFSGLSMTATVLLQFTLAGSLLKKFGSSRAMLCLPIALLLVFSALTVMSGVFPAGSSVIFMGLTAAMGLRMAFLDSFFSPNFQIFFSSLPKDIRGRAKLTLEGVVKPAAIMLASLWLMFGAANLSDSLNMVVLSVAAAALVFIAMKLRAKYAESLTKFLSGFSAQSGIAARSGRTHDTDFIGMVRTVLANGEFEIQKFLIDELSNAGSSEFVALLVSHLNHADPRVRATIVSALGRLARPAFSPLLIESLQDTNARVVANTVTALGSFPGPEIALALEPFLAHENGRVRANTAIVLWRHEGFTDKKMTLERLRMLLDLSSADDCSCALFALGEIEASETLAIIEVFVASCDWRKLTNAKKVYEQLVVALGKKPVPASLDLLLRLAGGASGTRIADVIGGIALLLRGGIPGDAIAGRLKTGTAGDRNVLVRALQKSPVPRPAELAGLLRSLITDEIEAVQRDRAALKVMESHCHLSGVELLCCSVREESVDLRLQTMVFAIAILDSSGAIGKIIPRLFNADQHVRARAFEVLDNQGDIPVNRSVMGVLEERRGAGVAGAAGGETLAEAVNRYLADVNTWISRCADFAAAQVEGRIFEGAQTGKL